MQIKFGKREKLESGLLVFFVFLSTFIIPKVVKYKLSMSPSSTSVSSSSSGFLFSDEEYFASDEY